DMKKGEAIYKTGHGCNSADDCTSHPGSYCDVGSGLCIAPENILPRKTKETHGTPSSAVATDISVSTTKQPEGPELSNKDISLERSITEVSQNTTTRNSQNLEVSTIHYAHNETQTKYGALDLEVVQQLPGGNNQCPESAAMSDELRDKILSEHNTRRGNGKPLPAAGNMMKLKYSCELEAFAFSYAANCFFNSSDPENRPDTGENIAAVRNATTFGEALEQIARLLGECTLPFIN
ncbi:SCP-like protein, partial [Ancylostoma duodenale]